MYDTDDIVNELISSTCGPLPFGNIYAEIMPLALLHLLLGLWKHLNTLLILQFHINAVYQRPVCTICCNLGLMFFFLR